MSWTTRVLPVSAPRHLPTIPFPPLSIARHAPDAPEASSKSASVLLVVDSFSIRPRPVPTQMAMAGVLLLASLVFFEELVEIRTHVKTAMTGGIAPRSALRARGDDASEEAQELTVQAQELGAELSNGEMRKEEEEEEEEEEEDAKMGVEDTYPPPPPPNPTSPMGPTPPPPATPSDPPAAPAAIGVTSADTPPKTHPFSATFAGFLAAHPLTIEPERPMRVAPALACPRPCLHGGWCNHQTGTCACPSGRGGVDCGSVDPWPCNHPDGLDVGSKCAGECDESNARCKCGPGTKYPTREISPSCQPNMAIFQVGNGEGCSCPLGSGTARTAKENLSFVTGHRTGHLDPRACAALTHDIRKRGARDPDPRDIIGKLRRTRYRITIYSRKCRQPPKMALW